MKSRVTYTLCICLPSLPVFHLPLSSIQVLKNARPIVDGVHPLDQHLIPLAGLEIDGNDAAPKKDLHVTEYIYMIKEDLPPTLLPVIKESSNRVWFHHICYLIHRALAYSLHVHCKVVESRYALTTEEATKVAFSAEAASTAQEGDEAIEKVAEFWCFTPIKLRKNYASYWTSSGKGAPVSPSTNAELVVLQVKRLEENFVWAFVEDDV